MAVVVSPWMTAFSIRLERTCIDEDGVHRDHEQLRRDLHGEFDVRKPLAGLLNSFRQDFLRRL